MPTNTATVPEVAQNFRRLLLREDKNIRRMMAEAWGRVRRSIGKQAEDLARSFARKPTANKVYRMQRLMEFEAQVQAQLAAYASETTRQAAEAARWAARLGLDGAAAITEAGGFAQFLTMPNEYAVEVITGRMAAHAAERMAWVATEVAEEVVQALIGGLGTGMHPTRVARIIRDRADILGYRAQTIARTEMLTSYREANRVVYAQSRSVTQWVWWARQDARTCPICWAMHGQRFDVNTPFETHPNCRCTMLPDVPGLDFGPTGEELFARLDPEEQKRILGKARFQAYQSGVPLGDMVQRYEHPTWGGGRRLRPVRHLPGMTDEEFARLPASRSERGARVLALLREARR